MRVTVRGEEDGEQRRGQEGREGQEGSAGVRARVHVRGE